MRAAMVDTSVSPVDVWCRVETIRAEGVTVVAVFGEVDLTVEGRLTRALLLAIEDSTAVLVDLCACTFMDSVGLAALLTAVRAAKAAGVRLGVASTPGGAPRALFDLTFGQWFFSCDDRATGLAALRGGP